MWEDLWPERSLVARGFRGSERLKPVHNHSIASIFSHGTKDMCTIVSTNAQVFTETSRCTDAHQRVPKVQPIARNAGVGVTPAALQHARALQHTLCVPAARISEQQHAALLLCSLLRSELLHKPATAPSIDSTFGKLLARRLIDHSGR